MGLKGLHTAVEKVPCQAQHLPLWCHQYSLAVFGSRNFDHSSEDSALLTELTNWKNKGFSAPDMFTFF